MNEMFKRKIDINLMKIDLSNATKQEVLEKIENTDFSKIIDKIVDEEGKQYAEFYDKCVLKSAFLKAGLWDRNCNPYIISENEKRKNVKEFCLWFISHIKDAKLTKKEIIKELESYSKDDK